MDEKDILSYEELSKILNRSIATLRHDVMNNRIPHVKLGEGRKSQVRFRRSDIDSWIESKLIPAKERSK